MTNRLLTDFEIDSFFAIFDVHGSGFLRLSETKEALQAMGLKEPEATSALKDFERLKDDALCISKSEFQKLVRATHHSPFSLEECKRVFRILENPENGCLDRGAISRAGLIATGAPPSNQLIDSLLSAHCERCAVGLTEEDFAVASGVVSRAVNLSAPADRLPSPTASVKKQSSQSPKSSRQPGKTGGKDKKESAGVRGNFVNGRISKTEARRVLSKKNVEDSMLSHREFDVLFKEADTDRQNGLTRPQFTEFLELVDKTVEARK